jgi:uncharacterized membrane protein
LDWESLIGGRWALWAGAASLFLAMALFLAYTWKSLPPPPPWARVAMGVGAGTAFLGAGWWSRERAQKWFSEGLLGAGLSILYLSIWAAAQEFRIVPLDAAFVAMALITALGVWLAVRLDAPSLSVLALCGGFLTPVVLQARGAGASGNAQALALLGYVAVLDAGILAVSAWKKWSYLGWLAFTCTFLLVGGWAMDGYTPALRWLVLAFVTLYFVLFAGVSCFAALRRGERSSQGDLLLLLAHSSAYGVFGFELLREPLGYFPGAFPLILAAAFALGARTVRSRAPRNEPLFLCAAGFSLLCLSLALPAQAGPGVVACGWALEAAILVILAQRLNARWLLVAGRCLWGCSFAPLAAVYFESLASGALPVWNGQGLPLLFSVSAAWAIVWSQRLAPAEPASAPAAAAIRQADAFSLWPALWAVAGGTWLLVQETGVAFSRVGYGESSAAVSGAPHFVAAAACALYALVSLRVGFSWRDRTLRAAALCLAGLSAVVSLGVEHLSNAPAWAAFWNPRIGACAVVAVCLGAILALLHKNRGELSPGEEQVRGYGASVVASFVLAALSLECYLALAGGRSGGSASATPYVLGMLWSVGGGLALWLGLKRGDSVLRAWSVAALVGSLLLVLGRTLGGDPTSWLPFWSLRAGSLMVLMAAMTGAARLLQTSRAELKESERPAIAVLAFGAAFVLLWALTRETYAVVSFWRAAVGPNWARTAQMSISLVWCAYGALALGIGVARGWRSVRLGALGLLCLAALKVFAFDLGYLDSASRIFSLVGLGLSLLFISWLYGRFVGKAPKAQME